MSYNTRLCKIQNIECLCLSLVRNTEKKVHYERCKTAKVLHIVFICLVIASFQLYFIRTCLIQPLLRKKIIPLRNESSNCFLCFVFCACFRDTYIHKLVLVIVILCCLKNMFLKQTYLSNNPEEKIKCTYGSLVIGMDR